MYYVQLISEKWLIYAVVFLFQFMNIQHKIKSFKKNEQLEIKYRARVFGRHYYRKPNYSADTNAEIRKQSWIDYHLVPSA